MILEKRIRHMKRLHIFDYAQPCILRLPLNADDTLCERFYGTSLPFSTVPYGCYDVRQVKNGFGFDYKAQILRLSFEPIGSPEN